MNCETFKKELDGIEVICHCTDSSRKQSGRFNLKSDEQPSCVVKCQSADDIAKVMALCKNKRMPVQFQLDRPHYHQYEEMHSANDNVVVINLSEMNTISQADHEDMIWIESGTKLADVHEYLKTANLTLSDKSSAPSKVDNFVKGCRWKMIAGKSGLVDDALQAIELVTTEGKIIVATENNDYKDLFWTARGGRGDDCGVITKYKFNQVKLKHELTSRNTKYSYLVTLWYASERDEEKKLFKELLACYLEKLDTFSHEIASFARVSNYDEKGQCERHTFSMVFECIGCDESAYQELSLLKRELSQLIEAGDGRSELREEKSKTNLNISSMYPLPNGISPSDSVFDSQVSVPSGSPVSLPSPDLNQSLGVTPRKRGLGGVFDLTAYRDHYPHSKASSAQERENIDSISDSIMELIFQRNDFSNLATCLSIHSWASTLGGQWDDKTPTHPFISVRLRAESA